MLSIKTIGESGLWVKLAEHRKAVAATMHAKLLSYELKRTISVVDADGIVTNVYSGGEESGSHVVAQMNAILNRTE